MEVYRRPQDFAATCPDRSGTLMFVLHSGSRQKENTWTYIHDGYLLILWRYVHVVFVNPAQLGKRWSIALSLFNKLQMMKLQGTVVTYAACISACEKGREWVKALQLLGEFATRRQPYVMIVVWCFFVCFAFDDWSGGVSVFFVAFCLRYDPIHDTVTWFSPFRQVFSSIPGFHLSIPGFVCLQEASKIQANSIIYNAAISACEKCKQWERALFLFAQLGSRRLRHTTVSYNAACCNRGSIDWSMETEQNAEAWLVPFQFRIQGFF